MNIAFGLPLALVALSALLIPILMHLDRRRSLKTLPFAAMRWIGSGHPPQRSVRVIEWLLLILRLLLIALIALWLAKPELIGEWRAPQRWLAVMPGVSAAAIQTSAANADRVVWLSAGFPAIDQEQFEQGPLEQGLIKQGQLNQTHLDGEPLEPPAQAQERDTASQLRQLDSELESADQLRVLMPPIVSGLDAQAIILSRKVEWQIGPRATLASSLRNLASSTSRNLAIRFDTSATASLPWLRAAIAAWSTSPSLAVIASVEPIEVPLGERINALIWLGAEPSAEAMQRTADGATLLHAPSAVTEHASDGALWPGTMQRNGRGQVIELAAPLDPAHYPLLHDAGFAIELHQRLFGYPAPPERAAAGDLQPSLMAGDMSLPRIDLRRWLGWLIVGVFALERLLASGRRLRGAA